MSATVYTGTELAVVTPEVWDNAIEKARYEVSVMVPLVSNKSSLVAKAGDIIHVPIAVKRAVQTLSLSTGTFTPASLTLTEAQLTVDQWLAIPEQITDAAKAQAFYDPSSDFGESCKRAFMAKYDQQLLSLQNQFGANGLTVGNVDNPKPFGKVMMLGALARLANRDIPDDDLSFVLPPDAFYAGIMNEAQLTDADKAGVSKNLLSAGFQGVFKLVGVPAYKASAGTVTRSGDVWKGLLFHKSAMAIAMQINNKYDTARGVAAGFAGDIFLMQSLDGVKAVRTDHAVVINIQAASEIA